MDWACIGKKKCAYKGLVRRPEGKRQLVRRKRKCKDDIKMDLQEMRWRDMDWVHLPQDRNRGMAHVNETITVRVA